MTDTVTFVDVFGPSVWKRVTPDRVAAVSTWLDAYHVPHTVHLADGSITLHLADGDEHAAPGWWVCLDGRRWSARRVGPGDKALAEDAP